MQSISSVEKNEARERERERAYHSIHILRRGRPIRVKVQSLLDLFPEGLSKFGSGRVREGVDPTGDGALIRQEPRHPSLILRSGPADEGGVVDDAVFGGIPLRLERPEERLLRAQNLEGRRGVFGKICQAPRVRDEPGADDLANELGEVGGDYAHLVDEVAVEGLAVVG